MRIISKFFLVIVYLALFFGVFLVVRLMLLNNSREGIKGTTISSEGVRFEDNELKLYIDNSWKSIKSLDLKSISVNGDTLSCKDGELKIKIGTKWLSVTDASNYISKYASSHVKYDYGKLQVKVSKKRYKSKWLKDESTWLDVGSIKKATRVKSGMKVKVGDKEYLLTNKSASKLVNNLFG